MVEIHTPGEGEKVSLLKNWREVFRDAKPAIGRLRGRIPPSRVSDLASASREQSESDTDVPSLVEDSFEDEMVPGDTAEAKSAKRPPLQVVMNQASELPVHPKKDGHGNLSEPLEPTSEDQGPINNGVIAEPSAEKEPQDPTANPSRRGRKRKASVSIDGHFQQSDKTTAETPHKAKKAATAKESPTKQQASSDPVRRSARRRN